MTPKPLPPDEIKAPPTSIGINEFEGGARPRRHSGDLCGVRGCPNLEAHAADVPLFRASGRTVELALCKAHHREMHQADDPIEQARAWVLESIAP